MSDHAITDNALILFNKYQWMVIHDARTKNPIDIANALMVLAAWFAQADGEMTKETFTVGMETAWKQASAHRGAPRFLEFDTQVGEDGKPMTSVREVYE